MTGWGTVEGPSGHRENDILSHMLGTSWSFVMCLHQSHPELKKLLCDCGVSASLFSLSAPYAVLCHRCPFSGRSGMSLPFKDREESG